MCKKKLFILTAVMICVAMTFVFAGCSEDEDSYTDESDITVEYLEGEYPDQLMADGAESNLGSVEITQTDTDNGPVYTVKVTGKEIVVNPDYEGGYYIAENNILKEYGVGGYAKFVYKDGKTKKFGDIETFSKIWADDPEQLYTVYCINGSVELMLPVDPEDVNVQN